MNYYYDSTDSYGDNAIWPPEDVIEKRINSACREAWHQLGALKFGEEYGKRAIIKELAKKLAPYFIPKYKMVARIKAELKGKVSERMIEKVLAELGDEYIDSEMRRRGKMAAEANKKRAAKEARAVTTTAVIKKEMFVPVSDEIDAARDSVVIIMRNGEVIDVFSDREWDSESSERQTQDLETAADTSEKQAPPAPGVAATTAAGDKQATRKEEGEETSPTAPVKDAEKQAAELGSDPKSKPIALSSASGNTLLWRKRDSLDYWSHPDEEDNQK